jgi:hypothetical protein
MGLDRIAREMEWNIEHIDTELLELDCGFGDVHLLNTRERQHVLGALHCTANTSLDSTYSLFYQHPSPRHASC